VGIVFLIRGHGETQLLPGIWLESAAPSRLVKVRSESAASESAALLSDEAVDPDRRLIAMSWAPVLHGCPHISPTVMGSLKLVP